MEYISSLSDIIYFGPYPNQQALNYLTSNNFFILDVRSENEHIPIYEYEYNLKTDYHIPDRGVPPYEILIQLIDYLYNLLTQGYRIYIHCRGGHGRSGLVAGCLYAKTYKQNYIQTMIALKVAHGNRIIPNNKAKWIKLGCPQTIEQKNMLNRYITDSGIY